MSNMWIYEVSVLDDLNGQQFYFRRQSVLSREITAVLLFALKIFNVDIWLHIYEVIILKHDMMRDTLKL